LLGKASFFVLNYIIFLIEICLFDVLR